VRLFQASRNQIARSPGPAWPAIGLALAAHSGVRTCRGDTANELPDLELPDLRVEPTYNGRYRASRLQPLKGLLLCRRKPTAFCFQLEGVGPAVLDGDDVGNTGDDAEPDQDPGLGQPAEPAVGRVERKNARRRPHPQVLEHGTLDGVLRPR
jgi:hypothetical protein